MQATATSASLRTPQELAAEFRRTLGALLEPEALQSVLEGRSSPDDHTDANMAMAAAFKALHGRETWLPSDVEDGHCTEAEADADLNLWNAAARIALPV